jgi:hypothetical protein
MASSVSISRLHAAANVSPAPVKLTNFGSSQADVPTEPSMHELFARSLAMPLRRRFGSPRGALSSPALLSTMSAPTAVDRNGAFAALAMRDRAAQAMNAAVGRWQAQQASDDPHADVRIQI